MRVVPWVVAANRHFKPTLRVIAEIAVELLYLGRKDEQVCWKVS